MRDTYTCVVAIIIFLAIPQNSSIRQNSVHIFRLDEWWHTWRFITFHNADFLTQTFEDFSRFFTHNTHIRINNSSCPAFFPTFQETRQRKKFNSRLPDSSIRGVGDSPTHQVGESIFDYEYLHEFETQNRNSSKASVRDLCWPELCELCWPLLFIFQVPQVQLVPPLEKLTLIRNHTVHILLVSPKCCCF